MHISCVLLKLKDKILIPVPPPHGLVFFFSYITHGVLILINLSRYGTVLSLLHLTQFLILMCKNRALVIIDWRTILLSSTLIDSDSCMELSLPLNK